MGVHFRPILDLVMQRVELFSRESGDGILLLLSYSREDKTQPKIGKPIEKYKITIKSENTPQIPYKTIFYQVFLKN
jgi:hypothetical protein